MNSMDKMCRLCMSRANLIHNVFQENLMQKIAICVSILINPEEESLPLEICALCTLKVKDFFEFRQNCLKVQQLLEQNRSAINETSKIPPLTTKIEQQDESVPALEPVKVTKVEVLVNETENDENLEEVYDEDEAVSEMEHTVERLEDSPEEVEEEFLENDEILLDFDDPIIGQDIEEQITTLVDDSKNDACESDMVEIFSLNDPSQDGSEEDASNCGTGPSESQIESLQYNVEIETKDESSAMRNRMKQNYSAAKPRRDEKEIYRSLLMKCETCGKLVERNRMEGHRNRHLDVRPFACNASNCGAKFHCKIALRLHTQGRHGTDQLPCNQCEKVYNSKKALYHHKKETHSDKQYECEQCGQVFVSKPRLNRHKVLHTDQREFKCPHCPKEFYRSNNLKVHIRSHTKEKPFACDTCDKAFGYQRLLRDHVSRHHKRTTSTSKLQFKSTSDVSMVK